MRIKTAVRVFMGGGGNATEVARGGVRGRTFRRGREISRLASKQQFGDVHGMPPRRFHVKLSWRPFVGKSAESLSPKGHFKKNQPIACVLSAGPAQNTAPVRCSNRPPHHSTSRDSAFNRALRPPWLSAPAKNARNSPSSRSCSSSPRSTGREMRRGRGTRRSRSGPVRARFRLTREKPNPTTIRGAPPRRPGGDALSPRRAPPRDSPDRDSNGATSNPRNRADDRPSFARPLARRLR